MVQQGPIMEPPSNSHGQEQLAVATTALIQEGPRDLVQKQLSQITDVIDQSQTQQQQVGEMVIRTQDVGDAQGTVGLSLPTQVAIVGRAAYINEEKLNQGYGGR